MKIEKDKYPIFLLEELEDLLSHLRELAKDNASLVSEEPGMVIKSESTDEEDKDKEKEKEKEFEIVRFGYKGKGDFLFTIDHFKLVPEKNNHKSLFEIYVSPESDKSIDNKTSWTSKEQTVDLFSEWIWILKRYDRIKFQDPITEQYENEIFDVIKLLDEDAEKSSFDTEQQIFMLKYLDNAQKYLELQGDKFETVEIIEELKDLKKDVTSLTKNGSMRRLSSVFAKAKKQGMILFKDLMIMFKKDLMKKVLTEGFEGIEKLLSLLQSIN